MLHKKSNKKLLKSTCQQGKKYKNRKWYLWRILTKNIVAKLQRI